MKKISFLVCSTLVALVMNAQLKVTSGATITITGGAVVFCGGDVTNDAGGTITNNGKLEVQGSFANAGTYNTTTADDSLIMSGANNVTLNGGSSVLTNLWIIKTAAANEVKLAGTTLLSGKLDYDEGNFTTDPITNPSFLFSAPVTATFDFAANKEIVGRVRRTGWSNGAMRIFNQANMQVTTAGGTPPTDFTVTMIPQSAGGDPTGTEREVKRKFQFAQTGGTGFTSDIRYPYIDGELNTNTEGNLVPWQNVTAVWNGKLTPVTRDGATNYVSTTGLTTTEIANEWKLADPNYTMNATAFLRGAWNTGGFMNASLISTLEAGGSGLLQVFNTPPFNYVGTESVSAGFFTAHPTIVDWALVELRMPADGLPASATSATIVGRRAGFFLSNGTIVGLDGATPISFDISKQGTAFIVIRHRNHLGVMSNAITSNATGFYNNDFRSLANIYKPVGAPSDPVVLLPSSGNYGFWGGDANKNGIVNATDVSAIKNAIAASTTGYSLTDVTLSGTINATDVSLTKATIAASGTGGAPARQSIKIVKTNIPDPIGPEEQ
ncbi:MAG: hypothetical protein E6H07_02385 [Bacteroidetes bacterium]|nr:MAG: hypothetical protein E6H07_02385 [Bacteroidota bacterium]